jgi:hypothetical protein
LPLDLQRTAPQAIGHHVPLHRRNRIHQRPLHHRQVGQHFILAGRLPLDLAPQHFDHQNQSIEAAAQIVRQIRHIARLRLLAQLHLAQLQLSIPTCLSPGCHH